MKNSKHLKIFASCIISIGFKNAIICDLQRETYVSIPKQIAQILTNKKYLNLDSIAEKKPHEAEIIYALFDEIVELGIGFYTSEPHLFPPLQLDWKSPLKVTNSILDYHTASDYDLKEALMQLSILGCEAVQLRFFDAKDPVCINELIQTTHNSRIRSIDLILQFTEDGMLLDLQNLIKKNLRISNIVVFSAPYMQSHTFYSSAIYFLKDGVDTHKGCGIIQKSYFASNLETFTESHHHNSCLNRKISIDIDGNIKNCPSMSQSFGNIKDTTLQEALNHPDFKKYWNITKDQIEVCKDCEFRYICTDCRAYIENPEDMYSKPLKCGYNPYTAEWEEWSTNPLKQKAIDYYGMREVLPEFKMKPDYVPARSTSAV